MNLPTKRIVEFAEGQSNVCFLLLDILTERVVEVTEWEFYVYLGLRLSFLNTEWVIELTEWDINDHISFFLSFLITERVIQLAKRNFNNWIPLPLSSFVTVWFIYIAERYLYLTFFRLLISLFSLISFASLILLCFITIVKFAPSIP